MAIWLVRHGETELNAARVLQMPETPLSRRGLGQAAALAERLRSLPIEQVVSSDYARASRTAELAAQALGLALELDPLLQERSFGELRGSRYDDLPPNLFDPGFVPPGGESWDQFRARVQRAWSAMTGRAAKLSGDLLVVSHGLVCTVIAQQHLGMASESRAFPNASLTRIDGPPWRAGLLACIAHLAGDSGEEA
jgi:probable phosphoglycerate mutase